MDGASIVPAFAEDQPWNVPVVTEGLQPLKHDVGGFPDGLTEMGLRTGRYAYFRYSTGEGELYDLQPTRSSCARASTTRRTPRSAVISPSSGASTAPVRRRLPGTVAPRVPGLGPRPGPLVRQGRPRPGPVLRGLSIGRDTRSAGYPDVRRRCNRHKGTGYERRTSDAQEPSGSSGCLRLRSRSRRKSASSSGAMGRRGRAARRLGLVECAAPLDGPHEQVDRERQQGEEKQDLQHASRVGGRWSPTTLIS